MHSCRPAAAHLSTPPHLLRTLSAPPHTHASIRAHLPRSSSPHAPPLPPPTLLPLPPQIKLNDDLIVGRRDTGGSGWGGAGGAGGGYGSYGESGGGVIFLDDAQFHEVAELESFDVDRTITLVPPEGEFALMNYRTSHGIKPPFRLSVTLEPDMGRWGGGGGGRGG